MSNAIPSMSDPPPPPLFPPPSTLPIFFLLFLLFVIFLSRDHGRRVVVKEEVKDMETDANPGQCPCVSIH